MVRGNTLRTARTTVVASTPRRIAGRLTAADPRDFFKFTVGVRSSFNLTMTGIARSANADVFLLNNRGGVLRPSRNPRNRPERIEVALDPGVYYVRAQRRTGTTRYVLSLSATPINTVLPDNDNSFETATLIPTVDATNRTQTGFIGTNNGVADPEDFYRFTLPSAGNLSLQLTGLAADANIQLFDSSRNLVAQGDSADRIVQNLTQVGATYFIKVLQGGSTPYTLNFSLSGNGGGGPTDPPPPPPDNGGNTFGTASALAPNLIPAIDFNSRSYSGDFVGDVDPQDFFSFSPTTAGNLSLQLTGLTADANIELYDGNQSLIASGGATDNILQNIAQPGGTYFIRVFQASAGNNTNYTLNLSLTPIDTVGDTPATAGIINDLVPTTPPAVRQLTATRSEFVGGADVDLYRFDLATSQTGTAQYFVGIDLANQGGNADLQLFKDNNGTLELLLSSNRGVNAPEQIGGTLGAGTYYLRVAAAAGGLGSPYSFTMYAESTQGQPTITRDISFGDVSSNPSQLTNVGGTLYFAASDPDSGAGLWRSTGGNLDQTTKVRNFVSLSEFVAAGNNLYFLADDGQSGTELWKYDGTTAIQLTDNPGNSAIDNLTAVGNNVYFTLSTINTVGNPLLWRTDGTVAGTAKVGNPDLTIADTGKLPQNLVAVGNDLYYTALEDPTLVPQGSRGTEVWKITGAGGAGNPLPTLIDIDPDPGASSSPTALTAIGTSLFFAAFDNTNGIELRRLESNGTLTTFNVDGTFNDSLNTLSSQAQIWNIVEMGGNVYFSANGEDGAGEELWRVPVAGNATSATRVTNLNPNGSSSPRNLTVVGNKLFFVADNGAVDANNAPVGDELFVYDGTANPPVLLTGGRPLDAPEVLALTVVGTNLYFTMGLGDGQNATGRELWVSDGTVSGTDLVLDIFTGGVITPGNPGDPNAQPPVLPTDPTFDPNDSNPENLTNVNGRLFFSANNGLNGVELWTLT